MVQRNRKSPYRKLLRSLGRLGNSMAAVLGPGRPAQFGFVERMEPELIRGWVISRAEGPRPVIVLNIDGTEYPLASLVQERDDVASQHGEEYLHAGFRCELPEDMAKQLRAALSEDRFIEVRCGEAVLPVKSAARVVGASLHAEPVAGSGAAAAAGVTLESWGHFSIRGRSEGEVSIELLCNGTPADGSVVRRVRQSGRGGNFEVELPGYLWESDSPGTPETVELQLMANGIPVLDSPLRLSRARCANWISEICRMPEDAERQYRALLGLEHAHFGQLWSLLDNETHGFLGTLARTMELGEYLLGEQEETPATTSDFGGTASTLLVWTAMREFNERLCREPELVFGHVQAVARSQRLEGVPRRRFLMTTIPALCRSGELAELRSLLDFAPLYSRGLTESTWELSVVVALLAADGLFERAADLIWQICKTRNGDWLNTECIVYALERAQGLELRGELGMEIAERLRYAFIGLLDSFNGNWFSRLFDLSLVRGTVAMLGASAHYTDWQQRDTTDAAIRHYGLCPLFWQHVDTLPVAPPQAEFARARAAFEEVREAAEMGDKAAARIEACRESLAWLLGKKNVDAALCLRELLALDIVENGGQPSLAGCDVAGILQAADASESMRVVAFPGLEEAAIERMPGTRERVLAAIRAVSERSSSPMYTTQTVAYRTWQAARMLLRDGDVEGYARASVTLAEYAFALGNPQGLWLGADLLAELWSLDRRRGAAADAWLDKLGEIVRRALADEADVAVLPAALCTALERVAREASGLYPEAFLREMRELVRKRFGSRYEEQFRAPRAGLRSLGATGWFGDTLVVVYSCRKYLPTRVRAIRETWLRELDSRGIPWLVAVGDGAGEIEADGVLGLAVSDRYEDLPHKSLALFSWIYEKTDAQFVLKIDDDCFLDVERYFGTLSYRKHHYYGRIIMRELGGTDRLWHQPKSQGAHAKRSIDKSPEPSTYADGGGAYCLSRLAIGGLVRMSGTERGLRLTATSFMEDKLVGDLLAMARITPVSEDYESYQRRRSFPEAEPVSMWENTFFPSSITPTKVVHLDTDRDQQSTLELSAGKSLWPKKIWPTYRGVALNGWSNQLELLSPQGHALALLRHAPRVVAVVRNELVMLPHFLDYYRKLGVRCFLIVDNCSDDGTREYLLGEREDVVLFSTDSAYRDSHFGVAWQQALLGNLCTDAWAVVADADELLVYPNSEHRPLADFIAEIEAEGAEAVLTYLVDMYPFGELRGADLREARPFEAAPWFDARPFLEWRVGRGLFGNATHYLSALRHRLATPSEPHAFTSQKKALLRYRPWMRFSQGFHDVANARMAKRTAAFAHFKYHAGFEEKVQTEIRRKQHFNNAEEYQRYATMLAEMRGGFGVEGVSRRFTGSSSFGEVGLFGEGTARTRD